MSLPKVWTPSNSACWWSQDRRYRFSLVRWLPVDSSLTRVCIGLNPSTADETKDDRTVRRLIERAYDDNIEVFVMLNLFGWRATDPREMMRVSYPIGARDNNEAIATRCKSANEIVLCWGNHGSHLGRSAQVLEMLRPYASKLYCFGLTKSGEPRHPVRMAKNTPLVKWEYPT